MKFLFPLFAASWLLTACGRAPSDAVIRQKAVGAWKPDTGAAELITVNADGSVLTKYTRAGTNAASGETVRGTWRVEHGFMIVTATNADGSAPDIESNKVIRISEREWVLQDDEAPTNFETLRKQ